MPLNQMADKAKTKLRSMSSFQRLVLSFVFFFIVSVFVTAKAYVAPQFRQSPAQSDSPNTSEMDERDYEPTRDD